MFPKANAQAKLPTTKAVGDAAEQTALNFLQQAGLRLLARNYRTPGRGGGEIDLILRDADGTCVFVEVRQRKTASHGGAAASVSSTKQRRIVFGGFVANQTVITANLHVALTWWRSMLAR